MLFLFPVLCCVVSGFVLSYFLLFCVAKIHLKIIVSYTLISKKILQLFEKVRFFVNA